MKVYFCTPLNCGGHLHPRVCNMLRLLDSNGSAGMATVAMDIAPVGELWPLVALATAVFSLR